MTLTIERPAAVPVAVAPTDEIAPAFGYARSTWTRLAAANERNGFPRPVHGGNGSKKLWYVPHVDEFFARVSRGEITLVAPEEARKALKAAKPRRKTTTAKK